MAINQFKDIRKMLDFERSVDIKCVDPEYPYVFGDWRTQLVIIPDVSSLNEAERTTVLDQMNRRKGFTCKICTLDDLKRNAEVKTAPLFRKKVYEAVKLIHQEGTEYFCVTKR